jgi:hypothetical protein
LVLVSLCTARNRAVTSNVGVFPGEIQAGVGGGAEKTAFFQRREPFVVNAL